MRKALPAIALALGALVTYVDTRPSWDDTGVTAGFLLLAAGLLGLLGPERPWRWGLALGLWIPLLAIFRENDYSTMVALAIAMAGAYAGALVRRWARPPADGGRRDGDSPDGPRAGADVQSPR